MTETYEDQLSRVELMASGDDTWDLSPNDVAALSAVLARLKQLEDATLHEVCTKCNAVLHSIVEGQRGTCSGCWFKGMSGEKKQAMNKLISMAFKTPKPDQAEIDGAIDDAFKAVKPESTP